MNAASAIVRLAARTLPAGLRARYREQWLADLRDADEAGVRPSEIVMGSLSFAATLDRPLFVGARTASAENVARRSHLAIGLALGAAVLAVSYLSDLFGYGGLTGNQWYDLAINLVTAGLFGYGLVAPIMALVLVLATRGVSARTRWAVILLAIASSAPLTLLIKDTDYNYISPFAVAFIGAAVLIVIAGAITWRPVREHSTLAPAVGAVAVLAIAGVGLAYAIGIWGARTPLVWGPLADPAYYAEWVQLKAEFEQLVLTIFQVWAVAGVALAVLVFAIGRLLRPATAVALGLAVVGIVLVASAGALNLVELGVSNSTDPGPLIVSIPMRLAGQLMLVAVTLVAVGGVRYLPRIRHRRDVEGAVEPLKG